jgi:hypothetical protein
VKFDFALLLTVLSAFTGVVWLMDALFFAKSRKLMVTEGEEIPEPVLVDYSRSLFPVLFFVLVLRSFLAEPFRIPSESMMPNLLTGGARATLDALAPAGHAIDIHLTLTDEYPWAQAFVILSARRLEQ